MQLTSDQLSALKYFSDGLDRVGYYSALSRFEGSSGASSSYGDLALDVVLNKTLSGATANVYLINTASSIGVSLSNDELAQLSIALMREDYAARLSTGGDASVDRIKDYHQRVFEQYGIPIEAWTPYQYLNTFETATERQNAWEAMLSNNSVSVWLAISSAGGISDQAYYDYVDAVTDAAAEGEIISSGHYTPYNVVSSGTTIIGVSQSSQDGTIGNDVIMAVATSNNILNGEGGNDIIYGLDGDDTLIGGKGGDALLGGNGLDVADYSSDISSTSRGITISINDTTSMIDNLRWGADVFHVEDSFGFQDTLSGIEGVDGSSLDDTLRVAGSLASISAENLELFRTGAVSTEEDDYNHSGFDGKGNDGFGDLLDFSNLTDAGIDIFMSDNGNTQVGLIDGPENLLKVRNFEDAIGTSSSDKLTGNNQNNILIGGLGEDFIDGGAGDDTIIFDGNDVLVRGGEGRDVGYIAGTADADVDFSQNELEVVVGGKGDDYFYLSNDSAASGASNGSLMAAGGHGDDAFFVTCDSSPSSSNSPAVVWGGEGADTINIYDSRHAAGLLVANVSGLTDDNFCDFNLDMLGLGTDFDWSNISAVILNPDSDDQFYSNGSKLGSESGNFTVNLPGQYYSREDPMYGEVTQYSTSINFDISSYNLVYGEIAPDENGNLYSRASAEFSASFLGDYLNKIQTSTGIIINQYEQPLDPNTLDPLSYGNPEDYGFDLGAADASKTIELHLWDGSTPYIAYSKIYYYVDFQSPSKPWDFDAINARQGVDALNQVGPFDSVEDVEGWFVAGGSFGQDGLSSNGVISVNMPSEPDNVTISQWLEGVGFDIDSNTSLPDSGNDQEGSPNAIPPTNLNLNSGSGLTIIDGFDPYVGVLTLDGTTVNPNSVQDGITVSQVGSDVKVEFGVDDSITLTSVNLDDWFEAASSEILGNNAAELLIGTDFSEIIAAGAGNDTIAAGDGNDTIIYTSGDDLIIGKGNIGNRGDDVLDLSRYNSDQVRFSIMGENAEITTPDGTIYLEWQARGDVGDGVNNIQTVIFSDIELDELEIKARALGDQSSSGDDFITGTGFDDLIWGSAGNDSISAGAGSDVIVYSSGNDSISGGAGADSLDLRKYLSGQVKFSIHGRDVLVTTPDGTITLALELNKPVGDANSNIEQVLFSDASFNEDDIRRRALADQSTIGDDYIYGSPQNDLIIDGVGNDSIAAGAGDDTIVYTSGDDLIVGKGNIGNPGDDFLDLRNYSSTDVTFSASVDNAKIVTPDGEITLEFQTRNQIGTGNNIEHVIFSDTVLDEAAIKSRALLDQASSGDDIITGTRQDDLIFGGGGDDTLSGSYGADIFSFSSGDGHDLITDFSSTEDIIQFQGLAFSDLTIEQIGNDTTIQYGIGDQITLHNVSSASLSPSQFQLI